MQIFVVVTLTLGLGRDKIENALFDMNGEHFLFLKDYYLQIEQQPRFNRKLFTDRANQ